MNLTLPADSDERKEVPITSGVLCYFPAALAGVARVSKAGNDKHNPGEPLHHARGKSTDHADCIVRHLMDVKDLLAAYDRTINTVVLRGTSDAILVEASQLCWRALALSQELHERFGAPLAPGARLPVGCVTRSTNETLRPGFPITPGVYRDRAGNRQTVLKIDDVPLPVDPYEYPARGPNECWNLQGMYWNEPGRISPKDLVERIGDLPA